MTAQRLVRGSKGRVILGICIFVFCAISLTVFQKTKSELESLSKNYDLCVQQQDSLSTQLQVIVDYKTRLEKSLQSEKTEHKHTRTELESRISDEENKNKRFASLQQDFKLLQTEKSDLTDKLNKFKNEIVQLQSKVKEQEEKLKLAEKNKEKSLEHLKTLYMQMQIDKKEIETQLNNSRADHAKWESDLNHLTKINHQLLRELETYKNKNLPNIQNNINAEGKENYPISNRNISKQIEISPGVYQISDDKDKPVDNLQEPKKQIDAENKDQSVLQKPNSFKSSTKAHSVTAKNADIKPLASPTLTSSSKTIFKREKPLNDVTFKKVPPGFVPIRKQELEEKNDKSKNENVEDKNVIPEEIGFALPNRYRVNIIETELTREINKETKVDPKPASFQNEPEVNPQDAALEDMDQQKNPVQEDPLQLMNNNQIADNNNGKLPDDPIIMHLLNKQHKFKKHIDTLRENYKGNGDNGALRAPPGGDAYDENDGGQKEDLQIEEGEPEVEEDDDGDEYGNIEARQKDPAVRN